MFRNQYDTDAITFSPDGRIHQVEYAIEAVKQGSSAVGLRSNTHVVLACVKRASSELASYLKKLIKLDDHVAVAFSGLTSDGRVLSKWMVNECLNYKFVFGEPIESGRLVKKLSDKSQRLTQDGRKKRPHGVGFLVASMDRTGPHIYQTVPDGEYFELHAQAIGARSQAAKTYLEKHFKSFESLPLQELIDHALTALKGTVQHGKLTQDNVSIGFAGRDVPFSILEDEAVLPYLARVTAAEEEEEKKEEVEEGSAAPVEVEDVTGEGE